MTKTATPKLINHRLALFALCLILGLIFPASKSVIASNYWDDWTPLPVPVAGATAAQRTLVEP